MCGITGVYHFTKEPVAESVLKKMNGAITHRGPDGEGIYINDNVGLGHRRLAIIDLSPTGHQPMESVDRQLVLTYNGEIYNFPELKTELEGLGYQFRSRSDSEVLLYAYKEWGIKALDKLNGMFAFAIWDEIQQQLFLARDRYGVKPLYYYANPSLFLFGSEIKAILAHPSISNRICLPALNEYFTFQNILTDLTLFEGIKILPAGHYLILSVQNPSLTPVQYWDYDFTGSITLPKEAATEELKRLFNQAVTRQLISDVPIGSYLSGGMDSGSITAVARQHLGRMTTFTGGFDLSSASGLELGFDERSNSEMLANLLQTEHYEMVLHAGDMEHIMPELIWHLEDLRVGQCYPNYYIARLASKFVKVVLSGAGGDELFGGYPWRYYRGVNSQGANDYYQNYYNFWQRLVGDEEKVELFNLDIYRQIRDHSTFDIFRNVFRSANLPLNTKEDFINASLYFEFKTFLHGLLVVEDKISMAHSLETRVPFLDNDIVDFACHLPPEFKLRYLDKIKRTVDEDQPGKRLLYNRQSKDGKMILREAMKRVIPSVVTERVKQGFSGPDASWFRGESINYVNRLLRDPDAKIYDYIEPAFVKKRLDEHGSGQHNHRLFIWSLLSFEWWCRQFL